MLGSGFAGFRLVEFLGRGAFGETYKAERDGHLYAVKVLHESVLDSVDMARFQREVQALRQPPSEHLVECSDWGKEVSGGRTYHWLAMPYFEGQTLAQELAAAGGVLPPARASLIVRGLLLGLEALHSVRIVHRDIKPDNVFITQDGVVKLLDLGLARFLDLSSVTQRGILVGTPGYAAPEQWRGEPDVASDLYAAGVVLFELLTGRLPFSHGDFAALMYAVLHETPEPPSAVNPQVPAELDDLVLRLLEKEPLRRPATAAEVAEALKPQFAVARQSSPHPRDAEPLLFVRVGNADAEHMVNATLRGDTPTGVVVGITERAALPVARRGVRQQDAHFLVDPLLLRTAFANFSKTRELARLPYSPTGVTPWQPEDLRDGDLSDNLARAVITEQHNCGATALLSANFAVTSLEDPWLRRASRLLDASLDAAAAVDKPLFALVAASMDFLCTEEAVLRLANRMRRGAPDGYWLMLDSLAPPGAETQMVYALRLALLLQDTGVPVVLSRVGTLRYFFLACGVAGVDVGLGRSEGFRLSDWRQPPRQGGPGRPPARFEFPSLLCSLPRDKARAVLDSGLVAEATCDCNACLLAGDVEQRLDRSPEHNLAMLNRQQLQLADIPVGARVAMLRDDVARARAVRRRMNTWLPAFKDRLEHLKVFENCLDEVERSRLLEPGRAARRAG